MVIAMVRGSIILVVFFLIFSLTILYSFTSVYSQPAADDIKLKESGQLKIESAEVQRFIQKWQVATENKDAAALISLVALDFRTDDGKDYTEFKRMLNEAVPRGLNFALSEAGFYRDANIVCFYPVNARFPDGNQGKLIFFLRKGMDGSILLFEVQSYRGSYYEQPKPRQELTGISLNHSDISKINTTGFEAEPTVTGDGNVLYVQCSPRMFFDPHAQCTGPDRPGMRCAEMGEYSDPSLRQTKGIRTFRSEWDGIRWGTPQVQIPSNLPQDTWLLVIIGISSDDQHALLIVHPNRGDPSDTYIMHRQADGKWGPAQPIEEINRAEGGEEDGQFLVGSSTKFYFMTDRPGGEGGADIWLYDMETKVLKNIGPPVNTLDGEWFPKPDGRGNLYFTRDGLYVYDGKTARKLSLGGRTDYPAIGGSVTADGSLLFYRLRVRPQAGNPDGDWDIYFSRRIGDDAAIWSEPVPVDAR